MNNTEVNKRKRRQHRRHHDNDSEYDSDNHSDEEKEEEETHKIREKKNPSIRRFIDSIPLQHSSCDDNSEEEEEDRPIKRKKKGTIPMDGYDMGLNITDDYFVIDEIRKKKPIPREDGYEFDLNDHKNWDKRPYGPKYYDDQLERLKLLNQHPDYVFIRTIAGAMSRSPIDLFQEEDMNRLLQEQEESRLRLKLELKRKIVSSEVKTTQLVQLRGNLRGLKDDEAKLLHKINGLRYETKDKVAKLLGSTNNVDIFGNLCYYDEDDENIGKNKSFSRIMPHFSFSNVIDILYLLDVNNVSIEDKKRYLSRVDEQNEILPLMTYSTNKKKGETSDINDIFLFKVYFTFQGQYSCNYQVKKLTYYTIDEIPLENLSKPESNPKNDPVILCDPIIISTEMKEDGKVFNKPFELVKESYDHYLRKMNKSNVKSLPIPKDKIFEYMETGTVVNDFDINDYIPPKLTHLMNIAFKGESSSGKKRGNVIMGYFLYKWLKRSKWDTVKAQLSNVWRETMMSSIKKQLKGFGVLRELYYRYMNNNGIMADIHKTLDKVTSIENIPDVNDKNVVNFERQYKGKYIRRNHILDKKFLQYLSAREEEDKYEPFADSSFHSYLDIYLRYNLYLLRLQERLENTIAETEGAIEKTIKIVNKITQERDDPPPFDGDGGGGRDANPLYIQRKSFTSQPSISGIVMLKEEIVTFIQEAYNITQRYCTHLQNLPLEGYYYESARDAGLMTDFATFIATLISDNHLTFPDQYKSKHHHEHVIKTKVDRFHRLKQYGYSITYDGKITIFNRSGSCRGASAFVLNRNGSMSVVTTKTSLLLF
jgi:hypothetical protein